MRRERLPDAYWRKDVALFFGRRVPLVIKFVYPLALIVPVAASGIPARYAAAVVGIVAVMAGTFGAGETLTADRNDGILARVALTPVSPYRLVFEVLAVNALLDFLQLLPALLVVFALHPVPPLLAVAALFAVLATLVTANCIGIFIANFTTSPADVLLFATAILFPLIYVSGFFRNADPQGVMLALRGFVPFAYANDALKAVFGAAPLAVGPATFLVPAAVCSVLVALVCLTGRRLLSPRY